MAESRNGGHRRSDMSKVCFRDRVHAFLATGFLFLLPVS